MAPLQLQEETLSLLWRRIADTQSTKTLAAFADYFSGVADNIQRKLK
jgi:hypothetical protein